MRLTFLGTAAAEGFPALWCRCERCTTARHHGGRNLRFRSAALVNDDLMLDAGPDLVASAVRLGVDLAPAQALLVTHPHTDHLDPSTFLWRRQGFCSTPLPVLRVYAARSSLAKMMRVDGQDIAPEALRMEHHRISAFQSFDIRTGGALDPDPRFPPNVGDLPESAARHYRVWTFAASHAGPEVEALFFAVQQREGPEVTGRTELPAFLYATDTGPFRDETWSALDRLVSQGVRFSATAIDSTMGLGKDSTGHMSLRQMEAHQLELERRGLLASGARRLAHHFSHNGTPPYDELAALLAGRSLLPAYDGLTFAI